MQQAIRDEKGRLLPGHPPTFTGFKVGQNVGGAPKSLRTEIKDAHAIAEDAMPDIFKAMIARAKGEVDCPPAVRQAASEYLADRIYGKPNQPLSNAGNMPLIAFIIGLGYSETAPKQIENEGAERIDIADSDTKED